MNKEFFISAFRHVRLRMLSRSGADADDSDREDALQEAFCRLWTRKEQISSQSEAEGFLTVTARNIRIDKTRRIQAHPEVDLEATPELADSSEEDTQTGLISEVTRLIESALSERDREILYRRDRDGWEFDAIAEQYGLSEANVRMIVSRGRKTIREIYRKRNGI